jgi:ATP-binding cassette, subfamily B, bacterial
VKRNPMKGWREKFSNRWMSPAFTGRILALKMLWSCGPQWALGVVFITAADSVVPVVMLTEFGRAVGQIPAAYASGIHSAAGHRLLGTLVLAVGLYVLSLLTGPVASVVSSFVRVKMGQDQQSRLMNAVSKPVGIGHLEDPEIIDRLQLAQGNLMTYSPTDAPVTLAGSIGDRLGGVLACVVIAEFRWWLGLGMLAVWVAIRPPLRRVILIQIKSFRGEIKQMRRASYFLGLANRWQFAKEVRVFGLAAWVIQSYRHHWYAGMASSWRSIAVLYRRVTVLFGVVLATFAVACATVAWTALHHDATLTQVATVLTLLPQTMAAGSISFNDVSLEWMVSALPDLPQLEASLSATKEELRGHRTATGLPVHEIRFENVTFGYPRSAANVLAGLDLELPMGRSTALVGVNGAGKTTLVKLMCRLHDPTAGRVTVDGIPLNEFDPQAWRRQISAVLQDFNEYPLSVADNIAMGAIEFSADREGMRRAAERADALSFIEKLPGGWDTILSRQYTGGVDLSGGQWQRVALARALFAVEHGARILILDEPTSQLDIRAEAAFFDRFLNITKGTSCLVISHRFSTVRQADHIVVLEEGRIREQGSHSQLLSSGGKYANMFRTQSAAFSSERERAS